MGMASVAEYRSAPRAHQVDTVRGTVLARGVAAEVIDRNGARPARSATMDGQHAARHRNSAICCLHPPDRSRLRDPEMPPNIIGIRQIKIPVSELQRSVDWYCALLGVRLHREFVEEDELAGAVLLHPAGFVISVRLRSRVPGNPYFPGFDLFSLGVESIADLEELRARATSLGSPRSDIVDRHS